MARTSAVLRLERFLRNVQTHAQRIGAQALVLDVLAAIGGKKRDDLRYLHRAYTRLIRLADAAYDEILDAYSDSDLPMEARLAEAAIPLRPIADIRGALLSNSIHSTASVLSQFQLNDIAILAVTATRRSSEEELNQEALERARAAVNEALETVLTSKLHPNFKAAFASEIAHVLDALNDYQVYGPEGVADAVSRVMSTAVVARRYVSNDDAAVVSSSMSRLSDALTIVTGSWVVGHDILPAVIRLLSGG